MDEDAMNAAIEWLCKARGLTFAPWEFPPPWHSEVEGPCPFPHYTAGAESWPKAQQLRRQFVAEIEAAAASPGTHPALDEFLARRRGGGA